MDEKEPKNLIDMDRRRFLVSAAGGVAALAVGGVGLALPHSVLAQQTQAVSPEENLCIGCLTCQVACSQWHKSQGLSVVPRLQILRNEKVTPDQSVTVFAGGLGFVQQTCHQCEKPECLAVCPAKALRVDSQTGARYIDENACIQCGKCAEACPYEYSGKLALTGEAIHSKQIYYDSQKQVYVKCDLCRGREGGPACIERCPVNIAIVQGRVANQQKTLNLMDSAKIQWKEA